MPKRVNFVGIQHTHGVACTGYKQSSVRTGYEQVIAQRTSDLFASASRQEGTVTSLSETGIVVTFKDGTTQGIELGRRYGNAAGLTLPHDLTTDLTLGQTFKEGDILAYNSGFFEKDILNKKNVVWKAGITVKTVLYESNQTLEDASSISKRLGQMLSTSTTKVKDVIVDFKQEIRKIAIAGTELEPENILCMIEDEITSNSNLFDEESLNTLQLLSNQAPTAKVKGKLEKIEVLYRGDKEDMSDSLRTIANTSDRNLAKTNRSHGKTAFTGSVTDDLRINNEPLALDTAVIRFYITSVLPAGVGD